jgi:hypothetical protein
MRGRVFRQEERLLNDRWDRNEERALAPEGFRSKWRQLATRKRRVRPAIDDKGGKRPSIGGEI